MRRSFKIIYAHFLRSFLVFGSTLFHACLNIQKVHLSKKRSICIFLNSHHWSWLLYFKELLHKNYLQQKEQLRLKKIVSQNLLEILQSIAAGNGENQYCVVNYLFQITNHRLQITNNESQIVNYKLRIANDK